MDSGNFDKEHFTMVENDTNHWMKKVTENQIENISPSTDDEEKDILAYIK